MISCLELSSIITEIKSMLPQILEFIARFSDVVTSSGVYVITDAQGNMAIYIPHDMSDTVTKDISKRLGIINRLINSHGSTLNGLFQKGLGIEEQIKASNPNYVSQLSEQISTFKQLNSSYKH